MSDDSIYESNEVHPLQWKWDSQAAQWMYLEKLHDIHDVALHFGLLDRKPWADEEKICCINPEHKDTNPSMSLWRSIGSFKCWSCGYSGTLSKFIHLLRFVHKGEKDKWIEL